MDDIEGSLEVNPSNDLPLGSVWDKFAQCKAQIDALPGQIKESIQQTLGLEDLLRTTEHESESLRQRIEDWESGRTFHGLLRLPVELRDITWKEHYLDLEDGDGTRWCEPCDIFLDSFQMGARSPIMLACHQTRYEFREWLLKNSALVLDFSGQWEHQEPSDIGRKRPIVGLTEQGDKSVKFIPESVLARVEEVDLLCTIPRRNNWPDLLAYSINLRLRTVVSDTHEYNRRARSNRIREGSVTVLSRLQSVVSQIKDEGNGLQILSTMLFQEALGQFHLRK